MLNTIASCFVQWVACSNVGCNALFAVGAHKYRSGATGALYLKLIFNAPADADSSHYTVPTIAQGEQQLAGVCCIAWLAKYFTVEQDRGIRCNDQVTRCLG